MLAVYRHNRIQVASLVTFALVCFPAFAEEKADPSAAARARLVHEVLVPSGIEDARVIQSLLTTQRHQFVPHKQRRLAYYDMALPIGSRQTISSPFIVGFMTQALQPDPEDRVLEIGTGSGYQAAILSPLVKDVYSIEIVPALGERARATLRRLKYQNVHVRIGDGYKGWPEHAPFDKIIVTCSPEAVPRDLVEQLAEGGQIIVPVGERYQQTLYIMTKVDGKLERQALRPTLFVPMTGAAEEERKVLSDPSSVELRNLSFDEPVDDSQHLPGWYYQRQVERMTGQPKDGVAYVRFHNGTPGLASRVLQGFAIDGERYRALEVTAWIRLDHVTPGPESDMAPMIAISFIDSQRAPRGQQWMGPWEGTAAWRKVTKTLRVPPSAREAFFRVGLFGATGEFAVDGISVTPIPR